MSCRTFHVFSCNSILCKQQHSVETDPDNPVTVNEARRHAWSNGWNSLNSSDFCPRCSDIICVRNQPATPSDAKETQ